MLFEDMEQTRKQNLSKMQVLRRITYFCGINLSDTKGLKRFLAIEAFAVLICSSISVYGHLCFIIHHRKQVHISTAGLCTCLQVIISIIKLFLWVFIQERFNKLIKIIVNCELFNKVRILDKNVHLTEPLRLKIKSILEETWSKAQHRILYYVTACTTIISFYYFKALISNSYHQIRGDRNYTMLSGFATRYPGLEDAKRHLPVYPIVMIVDGYAAFAAGMALYNFLVAATFDGYFVYLTFHAVALFKALKEMIKFSSSDQVSQQHKLYFLKECVHHYNRSVGFCDEMTNMYSFVNISQLLISLVVLGVVLFLASVGLEKSPMEFINMVLFICAAGYELVIYCFNGQNVINETETLSEAWYSCDWYDASRDFKTIVYMMMLRSSRPYSISAAGFTTMSLPTFLTIVNTSGSYFMLLRNVSNM